MITKRKRGEKKKEENEVKLFKKKRGNKKQSDEIRRRKNKMMMKRKWEEEEDEGVIKVHFHSLRRNQTAKVPNVITFFPFFQLLLQSIWIFAVTEVVKILNVFKSYQKL